MAIIYPDNIESTGYSGSAVPAGSIVAEFAKSLTAINLGNFSMDAKDSGTPLISYGNKLATAYPTAAAPAFNFQSLLNPKLISFSSPLSIAVDNNFDFGEDADFVLSSIADPAVNLKFLEVPLGIDANSLPTLNMFSLVRKALSQFSARRLDKLGIWDGDDYVFTANLLCDGNFEAVFTFSFKAWRKLFATDESIALDTFTYGLELYDMHASPAALVADIDLITDAFDYQLNFEHRKSDVQSLQLYENSMLIKSALSTGTPNDAKKAPKALGDSIMLTGDAVFPSSYDYRWEYFKSSSSTATDRGLLEVLQSHAMPQPKDCAKGLCSAFVLQDETVV
jgi:hypothetical protein